MKLKRQHLVVVKERLIFAGRTRRQMHRAIGNSERIAMPVKRREFRRKYFPVTGHRKKSDFALVVFRHRSAEHFGDQLCA